MNPINLILSGHSKWIKQNLQRFHLSINVVLLVHSVFDSFINNESVVLRSIFTHRHAHMHTCTMLMRYSVSAGKLVCFVSLLFFFLLLNKSKFWQNFGIRQQWVICDLFIYLIFFHERKLCATSILLVFISLQLNIGSESSALCAKHRNKLAFGNDHPNAECVLRRGESILQQIFWWDWPSLYSIANQRTGGGLRLCVRRANSSCCFFSFSSDFLNVFCHISNAVVTGHCTFYLFALRWDIVIA